jgi:hypothetical protein
MSSSKSLSGGEDMLLSKQEFSSLEDRRVFEGEIGALAPQLCRAESRWKWRLGAVLAGAAASGAMLADRLSFWGKVPMVTSLAAAALTSGYVYLVISRLLELKDARRFEVIAQLSFKELGDASAGIVRVLGLLVLRDSFPKVVFQAGRVNLDHRLTALVQDPAWLSRAYERVGILRHATRSVTSKWGPLLQGSSISLTLLGDYAHLLDALSLLRRLLDDCRKCRGNLGERNEALRAAWEQADWKARGLANAFWARAQSRQRFLEPSTITIDNNQPVFNSILLPESEFRQEMGVTMNWLDWTVSAFTIVAPFAVGVWTLATTH